MSSRSPKLPFSAAENGTQPAQMPPAAPQPVHLASFTGSQLAACGARVDDATRRTQYPALVTCDACAQTFNAEQRRLCSPYQTEPEDF